MMGRDNENRRDGHTHSEFCPHAKISSTATLIEKAVNEGFKDYSITEHPPLPLWLLQNHEDYLSDYSMSESQIPDYLTHVSELKKKYEDKIKIRFGFEFEFLIGRMDYTLDLMKEYEPLIEDCLISLHFLPARDKMKMIDFSPEDTKKNLIPEYKFVDNIHEAYWEGVLKMVEFDYGKLNPRIGHLGLIYKFIHALPISSETMRKTQIMLESKIFPALEKYSRTLDFNVRGLSQPLCKRAYLDDSMLRLARFRKIPLVYGSDAHSTEDVGKHFDFFAANTRN